MNNKQIKLITLSVLLFFIIYLMLDKPSKRISKPTDFYKEYKKTDSLHKGLIDFIAESAKLSKADA